MNLIRDKLERLIFVKFLLSQAKLQKDLNRPLCSTAILTLHDCVECFLQITYEQLTGKSKTSSNNILDTYSEEINKVLLEENKTQINKAFIRRINDLRNQLKHATIFTDFQLIQNIYIETELFLIDFTNIVFTLSFDEISLIELIPDNEIKNILKEANQQISLLDYKLAAFEIGIAFYLLEEKVTNIEGKYGNNILNPHYAVNYLRKYDVNKFKIDLDEHLKENLIEIANDINSLQYDIFTMKKALSLSVNIKDYLQFIEIIPCMILLPRGVSGKKEFSSYYRGGDKVEYTKRQMDFCFDFVLNLAINC